MTLRARRGRASGAHHRALVSRGQRLKIRISRRASPIMPEPRQSGAGMLRHARSPGLSRRSRPPSCDASRPRSSRSTTPRRRNTRRARPATLLSRWRPASGGLSGFFGIAALPVELPLTTDHHAARHRGYRPPQWRRPLAARSTASLSPGVRTRLAAGRDADGCRLFRRPRPADADHRQCRCLRGGARCG